ncbi:NAD(P)/FAD-dependent oxidoreductase [Thauera sp. 2A1]|uniref:NAD(P)/FAD-dependent oxidoreductase n=1 Tax=Thauera sp. 2A1 TaxID=2570191 RepID=UPI001290F507|nr:NAD(P)-binding protein [Thauera sp. 2A1]KAI5914676.1 NAD(P)-binding protein [Thauera sp. 2A1]
MPHDDPEVEQTSANHPVAIAGAGPAGLAAAITLAHAGRRVVVHEARREVGCRFGADLQGLENWSGGEDVLDELRAQGLTDGFMRHGCSEGVAFDAWDRAYALRSPSPLVYVVERGPRPGSLDHALLQQALDLGVELRFGSRVREAGAVHILATGPTHADAVAAGYQFETGMANGFWLVLDDALAPGGYAYLRVMNGHGTVKSCMFADFGRQQSYVARTVERFRRLVGLDMQAPRFHAGAGNILMPQTAMHGGCAVVGERAGFQDALAGFGMRYAMRSGVLAARALLEGRDYDSLWRQHMAQPLRASLVNRALYARFGNRGYRWLLQAQAASGNTRAFLRWLYGHGAFSRSLMPWARRRVGGRRAASPDDALLSR